MSQKLDFNPLVHALTSFTEAVECVNESSFRVDLNIRQQNTIRVGVIQNFEFSYELSWKMLKRQLTLEEGDSTISPLSRRDLYRLGARKGLIVEPEKWFIYHQARNQTSHTYDQTKAQLVLDVAMEFLPSAKDLLQKLQQR